MEILKKFKLLRETLNQDWLFESKEDSCKWKEEGRGKVQKVGQRESLTETAKDIVGPRCQSMSAIQKIHYLL